MILLQFANQWNRNKLAEFHKEYMTQRVALSDRFPQIPAQVLRLIASLLDGGSIFDVESTYETQSQDLTRISIEEVDTERNKWRDIAQSLQGELQSVSLKYENEVSELKKSLRQEADERRKLELRIGEINASLVREPLMKRYEKEGLPTSWPMILFDFKNSALNHNLELIEARISEMNAPSTRTQFDANWSYYDANDINSKMLKVVDLLAKVTNLSYLYLNLGNTMIDDDGFGAIAKILQASKVIIHLELSIYSTKVGDTGMSSLASQLSSVPLHNLSINFPRTRVADKGVIDLVDSLHFLPNLSDLYLNAFECTGVTDRSAEKIAGFLASTNTTLNNVYIYLAR
eukprot:TRINITY_DN2010_c0_g7_i1.p1 TRINITY_DN2010_c0_g7~~TRINITY_DN2010_c0_g7_i1.p1  ORF type:complete len:345 (+),score=43.08 TRINITY_DN2010_c0_g7_i1:812-1846(+)